MVGDPNNEINFLHKLLLTDKQVPRICKAFANGPSANIKFSKTDAFVLTDPFGIATNSILAIKSPGFSQ